MPLFWLSLVFIAGIILAANLSLPASIWLVLSLFCLALLLLRPLVARLTGRQPDVLRPLALSAISPPLPVLLAVFFLGGFRFQLAQPDLSATDFIAFYNDDDLSHIVEGILVEPADERDNYTNLRLEAERIRPVGNLIFNPVGGLLLARVPPGGDWRYGDRVRLRGQLQTPPENEDFSYREYLARQGIYAYMGNAIAYRFGRDQGNPLLGVIYGLKMRALDMIYRLYPDPEASLLAGILLGVETGIPEQVKAAFQDTGTSHIIAISGFNITIVAALFATLFSRLLGRWRGALAALLAIALYTLLVGADAAVVRAAIMGGLSLFAYHLGRRQDGLNTLAFVAALMALFNPYVLWDVGFLLSFAATLGLLLYAEPLATAFVRFASHLTSAENAERLARPVGEYGLFTLAAQLTTLGIIVYYFQRFSLTSLIANPLILPAQPPVMIFGGLAVLLGLVYQPLGQLVAYLAWPFVLYTIRMVEWIAQIPGGVLQMGEVALFWVLLFYAVLFLLTFGGSRWRGLASVIKPSLVFTALVLLTVLVWRVVLTAPDGRLHLTVFDVGTGDALLIESPTGRYVLVDGGPSTRALSDSLGRRLPLTQRRLDYLVVAAPSDEGITALPRVLPRFSPREMLWAGPTHGTRAGRVLQSALNQLGIHPVPAQAGQVLELGSGAKLSVLAVGSRGAVLSLEWKDFRALLPVGMDFETLEALQADRTLTPVTALLLADSGYTPVNPPEWIDKLNPQVVLLSVAAGDFNGLPSPETITALEGYNLLRTDHIGWIELTTDGQGMWVEVERE
jgi:competence protein ComEC